MYIFYWLRSVFNYLLKFVILIAVIKTGFALNLQLQMYSEQGFVTLIALILIFKLTKYMAQHSNPLFYEQKKNGKPNQLVLKIKGYIM